MSTWNEVLHHRNKKGEFSHGENASWAKTLSDSIGGQKFSGSTGAIDKTVPLDGDLNLSGAEQGAIENYTSDAFESVNNGLRAGNSNHQIVGQLDSVFAKAPALKSPIQVMRGVNGAHDMFGPPGSKVGGSFTDLAYTSTTSANYIVDDFSYEDGAVVTIHVPPGAKAIRPHTHGMNGSAEEEVLLHRGGKYHIVADKVDSGGIRQISVVMEQK